MRATREKLEDRRRQLLKAATKVFARKGYHATRIADIATEAGVAYGLVYHYFKNKDEILGSLFEDNWATLVRATQNLSAGQASFAQKLDTVVGVLIEAYRLVPDVVTVLVVEIARSPMALDDKRVGGFRKGFQALADLIIEGQRNGEVRKGIDPLLAAYCLFGAMETILTGFVLKSLPANDEGLARVRKQVVDLFLRGFAEEAADPAMPEPKKKGKR